MGYWGVLLLTGYWGVAVVEKWGIGGIGVLQVLGYWRYWGVGDIILGCWSVGRTVNLALKVNIYIYQYTVGSTCLVRVKGWTRTHLKKVGQKKLQRSSDNIYLV